MKALALEAYRAFTHTDAALPEIGARDVLVNVRACGQRDVHGMDGRRGRRIPPIIMGHEAAGVITQIGAGVQEEYRVGDRVTFDSTIVIKVILEP